MDDSIQRLREHSSIHGLEMRIISALGLNHCLILEPVRHKFAPQEAHKTVGAWRAVNPDPVRAVVRVKYLHRNLLNPPANFMMSLFA